MSVSLSKPSITQLVSKCQLDRLSRQTKFTQRSSGKMSVINFVQVMTVASTQCYVSLEGMSSILREIDPKCDMTAQALMQRINRAAAAACMRLVFETALKAKITRIKSQIDNMPELLKSFNRVLLQDSTKAELHEHLASDFQGSGGGASKASVKIDLVYDIKEDEINSLEITDGVASDQTAGMRMINELQKDDLVMRDLGYLNFEGCRLTEEKKAYYLSRLSGGATVYLRPDDTEPIDLCSYIGKYHPYAATIDMLVYVGKRKQPTRLLGYRAPQEVADKRRRDLRASCKKRGRMPKKENLRRQDFSFFITNVPKKIWPKEVVGTIYRLRWQVELIFKAWKSVFNIHVLKGSNPNRIKCLIYARFIVILVSTVIYSLLNKYVRIFRNKEISFHKLITRLLVCSRLANIMLYGLSEKLLRILVKDLKNMCKQKRKRKTSRELIEEKVEFHAGYGYDLEDQAVMNF